MILPGGRMKNAAFVIVVALAAGCRAGPGEACAQKDDCQEGLLCHETSCKTPQDVAKIQLERGEAVWRETRARIDGQVKALQQRTDDLEEQLLGAKSEAEREQIREQLRRLRQMRGGADAQPSTLPLAPTP